MLSQIRTAAVLLSPAWRVARVRGRSARHEIAGSHEVKVGPGEQMQFLRPREFRRDDQRAALPQAPALDKGIPLGEGLEGDEANEIARHRPWHDQRGSGLYGFAGERRRERRLSPDDPSPGRRTASG